MFAPHILRKILATAIFVGLPRRGVGSKQIGITPVIDAAPGSTRDVSPALTGFFNALGHGTLWLLDSGPAGKTQK
ncbi:hypothetical protein CEP82_003715 [Mobiluncus mulieris]|nr:hypothetical protein CEP82_003715 [Mobiluncus mulieris]